MPVPRAARLASRKSVIPDPSLYGDPSDDSDEASPPLAPNPPIKTTTITTSSKGKARASTTTKAPSTTTNGKRKSNRSGTESLEEPQDSIKTTKQSSRPLNDTPLENDQDAPRTNKQSSSKRKRVEKGSEEDTSGQQDESSRLTASTKPTKSKGTSKRTKTNQQMVEEEEPEVEGASQASQSSLQKKGHFVVSLLPFSRLSQLPKRVSILTRLSWYSLERQRVKRRVQPNLRLNFLQSSTVQTTIQPRSCLRRILRLRMLQKRRGRDQLRNRNRTQRAK